MPFHWSLWEMQRAVDWQQSSSATLILAQAKNFLKAIVLTQKGSKCKQVAFFHQEWVTLVFG